MADGATDGAMTQIPRTHGRGSRQWVRTSIRTKLFSWRKRGVRVHVITAVRWPHHVCRDGPLPDRL